MLFSISFFKKNKLNLEHFKFVIFFFQSNCGHGSLHKVKTPPCCHPVVFTQNVLNSDHLRVTASLRRYIVLDSFWRAGLQWLLSRSSPEPSAPHPHLLILCRGFAKLTIKITETVNNFFRTENVVLFSFENKVLLN